MTTSKQFPVLCLDQVWMTYPEARGPGRTVLRGVDLRLAAGRSVALVGRSGSGKSTLLYLAAGIAVPSAGRVLIDGRDLALLSESGRTAVRRERVGLVFQFFHLLPHLNVAENIAVPGWIGGLPRAEVAARTAELLARVGLADRAQDPVGNLSGGEMQRVALCRALLNKPALLLADEPTGSLDDRTGRQVLDLLLEMSGAQNCALLLVTHSRELAGNAQRRLILHDGRIEDEDGGPP